MMTLSIMTLSIKIYKTLVDIYDTHPNFIGHYAGCCISCYAECLYAECHGAQTVTGQSYQNDQKKGGKNFL
jgi:hypothetical protein